MKERCKWIWAGILAITSMTLLSACSDDEETPTPLPMRLMMAGKVSQ